MKSLQVEALENIEDENGFTKHDVDGLNLYVYDGLELTDEVEIKYLYSIPIIGTVLSATGIKIKD